MVLLAFLLGLAAVIGAAVFCIVRGTLLWRQAKRTGGVFSSEVELFEERSARTERLLAEADRSNAELEVALARLRESRARLKVLTESVEHAKQRMRWLTQFLPAR